MIIQNTQRDIYTEGIGETKKMNIGAGVEAHIIKMLTENSYKQPLESSIREAASNALDSHVEAGVSDPIVVRVYRDDSGNYNLQIKDVGLGLDKEGFDKYIMGIGESTKRDSANLLGGYGAGAKAPLSLTNSYSFNCIKDGIERKFLIFKGAETPESSLIYEKQTDAHNGVTVTIPLGNTWNTLPTVTNAIKQQLAYFTGIYFEVPGVSNDFTVVRSEDWQMSDFYPFKEMHICLKDVYYPIEWSKLGISRINIPIGLRFEAYDGLQPVFNREELIYTEETKEKILAKIRKVADWFVNKYNENVNIYDSFLSAYPHINIKEKQVKINNTTLNINDLFSYTDIVPNEPLVEGLDLKTPEFYKTNFSHLLWEYEVAARYSWNGWKSKNIYESLGSLINQKSYKIILLNSVPTGNFKEFLKEKFEKDSFYVVKRNERRLGTSRWTQSYESYRHLLQLTVQPKEKWRDFIKEFQYVRDTILIEGVTDCRNLENSKEFVDWLEEKAKERKANREKGIYKHKTLNKQQGDITISYARKAIKNDNIVFEKKVFPVKDLYKNKFITLYFPEDQKELASELFSLAKVKVDIALIGKKEVNKLPTKRVWNRRKQIFEEKIIHNFKTLTEFMKPEVEPFKRAVTAFKASEALRVYESLSSGEAIFKEIVSKHYDDIQKLREYVTENICARIPATLKDSMLAIATEQRLFDLEIMAIVDRVKKDMELFDFVPALRVPNDWDEIGKARYRKLFNQMLLFKKKQYGVFDEYEIVPVPPVETLLALHEPDSNEDEDDSIDEELEKFEEGKEALAGIDEDFGF